MVAAAIVAGVLLRSSSLAGVGLGSDDFVHHAMIEGTYPVARSALDLFNFVSDSPQETEALMRYGTVPWWSYPGFRLSMLRPLPSALIALDYALFGLNPVAFHLHSMFWWVLLVTAVALLLRELLPATVAAVALLLFAVEEAHVIPVLWLANRNALVCLTFGVAGLWAHVRWRRRGRRSALALSLILFVLALLGGEWSFPVFAYLLAYELLSAEGPRRERVLALLPALSAALLFLLAQSLLGYGPRNSNLYVNPFVEPIAYLVQAAQRIPVLFADYFLGLQAILWQTGSPWRVAILSWGIIPARIWKLLPDWRFWQLCAGVLAMVFAVLVHRWSLHGQRRALAREINWLLLGAFLSLLPVVCSIPASRSLLPAAVGASPLLALALLRAFRAARNRIGRRLHKRALAATAVLLGGLYLQVYLPAQRSPERIAYHADLFGSVEQWVLRAEIDPRTVSKQDVFLVNGTEHTSAVFAPFVLGYHGRPLPRSWRILSAAPRAHDIYRTAGNQLEFRVLGDTMMGYDLETFYRAERFAFRRGDTIRVDGLQVEITHLIAGKPSVVRFTFDRDLEDPGYLFLHSSGAGMHRFIPPPLGEKVRLPKARFPYRY